MQELKMLSIAFFSALAFTVIAVGGSVYSAVETKKERQEATLPESKIAVPALSN